MNWKQSSSLAGNLKIGDKVREKSLSHTPADDTVFAVVHIDKWFIPEGANGSYIGKDGKRVCWCILATLNDGSVYHYDNLIKVSNKFS